jgi:hypothetical protein
MRHLALLIVLAAVLAVPSEASALPPADPDSAWVPDAAVDAVAVDGQTLYLGGAFRRLSMRTGGGVLLDAPTGTVTAAWPSFDGPVLDATPDGAGGHYVAGSFTTVSGVARGGLARIKADGTVDPVFAPPPLLDGAVRTIARAANRVFVGGSFDQAGATARDGFAAFDPTTGALVAGWAPKASGYNDVIRDLTPSADGLKLYVGGSFTCVGAIDNQPGCDDPGEVERQFAALLSTADGAAVDPNWVPNPDHDVHAVVRDPANGIWLAGNFDCMNTPDTDCTTVEAAQDTRRGLALVNAANGTTLAFNVGLAGGSVYDLALDGTVLTIAGSFACVGTGAQDGSCGGANEVARGRGARVTTAGLVQQWDPQAAGGDIHAVRQVGSNVWVGGRFDKLRGTAREAVGAVAIDNELLAADPRPNDAVRALVPVGARLLAGGDFSGFGGVNRAGLAAIDLQTGQPTAFNPGAGSSVRALAVHGEKLYVGGEFTSFGGAPRNRAAAWDLRTGTVAPWNPNVNGGVEALAAAGDAVYIGGSFSAVNGAQPQQRLAAVKADTGALVPGLPPIVSGNRVKALAVRDGILYLGGDFNGVFGGTDRQYAGAVDLASKTVTGWNPKPNGEVRAVALGADRVFVGGAFSAVGGQQRYGLAAVDLQGGAPAAGFTSLEGGTVDALAVDGDDLYVGGFVRPSGEASFTALALLSATTGGTASPALPPTGGGSVLSVVARDGAVYLGGEFTRLAGVAQARLATLTPKPSVLAAPSIAGAVAPGGSVTCTPGRWLGHPLLSYEWNIDGETVPGATGQVFVLPAAGPTPRAIGCHVTARTIRGEASADAAAVTLPALPDGPPPPRRRRRTARHPSSACCAPARARSASAPARAAPSPLRCRRRRGPG